MDRTLDFVDYLGSDLSIKILLFLDHPKDVVRAASVSRGWRRLVIANGFCKELVIRLYPEASVIERTVEVKDTDVPVNVRDLSEWGLSKEQHTVYAAFAKQLEILTQSESPTQFRDCISRAIAASSTDNFPDEHIENTLDPENRLDMRPSYWSSKGQKDPSVPETLNYSLASSLVIVDEILIRPFQAYFQYGNPIYSAQAVRFRMGYKRIPLELETNDSDNEALNWRSGSDMYIWSYVSPTYPMLQENVLQSFKLPRPVVCIGGVLQIEFLGRVQTQEMDELYYICIAAVQVRGIPLLRAFNCSYYANTGEDLTLKYNSNMRNETLPVTSENDQAESSGQYERQTRLSVTWHAIAETVRHWRGLNEMLIGTLLGAGEGDDDSDEEEPRA